MTRDLFYSAKEIIDRIDEVNFFMGMVHSLCLDDLILKAEDNGPDGGLVDSPTLVLNDVLQRKIVNILSDEIEYLEKKLEEL
jgi:hypothetical protein